MLIGLGSGCSRRFFVGWRIHPRWEDGPKNAGWRQRRLILGSSADTSRHGWRKNGRSGPAASRKGKVAVMYWIIGAGARASPHGFVAGRLESFSLGDRNR